MFHDDGLPHSLQPQFAPGEELALDATAWFVAFALVWAPLHEFDDLDYESMNEMQDQANSRKGHKDQVQKQNEKDQQPKDHEGKH